MRTIVWFIIALLAAPIALAQPGPAPGYESAAEYAVAYGEGEAEEAAGDPVGYAGGHASAEAVQDEAEHTAYVACWAADDAGVQHEACDAYYTPRGQAAPEQPHEEHAADETVDAVNATISDADTMAAEVQDAVNDTVADPGSAPAQVRRIKDAVVGFLEGVAQRLGDATNGIVDGLADIGGLGVALGDVGADGAGAVGEGLTQAGHGIGDIVEGATDAVGDGASAAGDAVADAGRAVGDGIADAASAVRDAVTGLFDQDKDGPAVEAPETPDVAPDLGEEDLLDDVEELLA